LLWDESLQRHCVGCQKAEYLMPLSIGLALVLRFAVPTRPNASEHGERPRLIECKPVGVFFGLVSAYSQNEVHGTAQRLAGFKHARQWALFVFLMFVIAPPPN
jgi:hypothetical protein